MKTKRKGILAWFAANHVAANLLMFLIIIAGLLSLATIKMEIFPDTELDMITVAVQYRGASPAEVEEGVCMRVEEAIAGVEGIKRMYSTAAENYGMVRVEVDEYADTKEVLDDIKAEVDRITTFPEETEKPEIAELTTRYEVLTAVVYGDTSEKGLRELAEEIRDDLTAMDNISQADLFGVRPYEISIEVSEKALRKYNLSFDNVAQVVASSSVDIPGGSVKTAGGEIMFRTKGQRYFGPEFEQIVLLTRNDGIFVRLGDVAEVIDGFEDTDISSRFDGEKAAMVRVYRVGDQGALDVANTVKDYIQDKKDSLPAGISISVWDDRSEILRSRIELLQKNGYLGLLLVFLCLTVFVNFRLAFWTTLGIPISFLGAFWLMPAFDVSVNMISLFAFIMSLGLVVDDAIVVGENIFAYREQGMSGIDAAIKGVREMAAPVVMAVLTTVFAFMPLLYVTGVMGKILRVIPIVVISVLGVSLVEAAFILPSHLSKSKFQKGKSSGRLGKIHNNIRTGLERFINGPYQRFASWAVRWRYVTLACGFAILFGVLGLIAGGYIKFTFFDPVEADNIIARLEMPQGTALEQTEAVVKHLEQAALRVREQVDSQRQGEDSIFMHISTTLGQHPMAEQQGPGGGAGTSISASHLAEINIQLLSAEERDISSNTLANMWREEVGQVPGVSSLVFVSEFFAVGDDISVELRHEDFDVLIQAAEDLKQRIADYQGTTDIADSFEQGKAELRLSLKDRGRVLGLTLADLARQVRQGFYGEEVQRIQRGRNDIRVMVRYPESERRSLANIENMRIRVGDREIPFDQVAEVEYGRGYATIDRAERSRVVNVTADVDEATANAAEINRKLADEDLREVTAQYRGLKYRFGGAERERNESLASLGKNFAIALIAIYGLLAIQFRSYMQPVIVMSAIPFGIVGAAIGHVLMGWIFGTTFNLSLLSMFGIVALSGVVVNDSLILIDLINRNRGNSVQMQRTVVDSAMRRFRPIMLTTLTTFFGLVPMMLEQSLQARFLIPMAISLAFGVLFATCITLVLVPALYVILEDFKVFITGRKN